MGIKDTLQNIGMQVIVGSFFILICLIFFGIVYNLTESIEEQNNYIDTEEETLQYLICLDGVFNTQHYYELKYGINKSREDYDNLAIICDKTVTENIEYSTQGEMIYNFTRGAQSE